MCTYTQTVLVVMYFPFSTGTADEVFSESDDEDFHIKVPPPPQTDTGTAESSSTDTNKGTLSYYSNESSQATGSSCIPL